MDDGVSPGDRKEELLDFSVYIKPLDCPLALSFLIASIPSTPLNSLPLVHKLTYTYTYTHPNHELLRRLHWPGSRGSRQLDRRPQEG